MVFGLSGAVGRKTLSKFASVLVVTLVTALGAVPASPASPDLLSFLDMKYVKQVTEHLTTFGSSPLGFRLIGTPQDEAVANYLADQMDSIGLEDVGVEQFPTGAWLFKGASVQIDGPGIHRDFQASSFGSVPGTRPGGVSGSVVFAGYGTKSDFNAVNVKDKIAFVWWNQRVGMWPNWIAIEAELHGAKAVIIASDSHFGLFTAHGGRAIGSFDSGGCPASCAPLVLISQLHAKWLEAALRRGPLQGRVVLDAQNLTNATGYQAIGQITGSVHPDRVIVFTAHHDAWFYGAADDSIGVAMILAIAKAVKQSGFQPADTWVFAPVTGEESGPPGAYYFGDQGALWRITQSHPEWASNAVAVLNWELHSPPKKLQASVSRELMAFVRESFSDSRADGRVKHFQIFGISDGDDGWTYSAGGAPAITLYEENTTYNPRYHTNFDRVNKLDFPGLLPCLMTEVRLALDLDSAPVPWSFAKRIPQLHKRVNLPYPLMASLGVDISAVKQAYRALEQAWQAAKAVAPSDCVATHVRDATRISLDRFTALGDFDNTAYPHKQVQRDIVHLQGAIRALEAGDIRRAMHYVLRVGENRWVPLLSKPTFELEQLHHDPSYAKLGFGALAQLVPLPDLWSMWWGLRSGKMSASTALAELRPLLASEITLYRQRVAELVTTMNDVAAELNAAAAC